jgi:AcrR family transcriptional regulator
MNAHSATTPKISRKQVLRDFRTRSLLEATRRVIAKQGFNAVTMERVARDAGITRGGIYLYFRNENQMILAAIEQTASEIVRWIAPKKGPEPW